MAGTEAVGPFERSAVAQAACVPLGCVRAAVFAHDCFGDSVRVPRRIELGGSGASHATISTKVRPGFLIGRGFDAELDDALGHTAQHAPGFSNDGEGFAGGAATFAMKHHAASFRQGDFSGRALACRGQ